MTGLDLESQHLSCFALRTELLEKGFALLPTPRLHVDEALPRGKKDRILAPFFSRRSERFPELARYGRWLDSLLRQALPEECLGLDTLEYRFERAKLVIDEVDKLHADGGYIRSLYTLAGPPTVYLHARKEHIVPFGRTLVITAFGRARKVRVPCTLHRRPGSGIERTLIVGTFSAL